MAEGQPRHVKLTATQRAHAQDAANAMGSDPIRAIAELVTNADDAYDGVATNRKGKIRIEWERHRKSPTILTVSDKARGMTQQEMLHRLGRLGERTSGFESGEQRRGFFGRGAKDVAHFGPARWESKRNGERTRFEIVYRSGATDEGVVTELPRVEKRDTGTTVTLDIQPRFPAPLESTLMDRLRRHYALRPILEDRRGREVTLNGDKVVWEPPRGALLADRVKMPIAGYDGLECVVTIRECAESLDDNADWEYWRHSLLITSGRAAYEVFPGGRFARGPLAPYLGRLFGTVDAPGINELIRDYDDRVERGDDPTDKNPSPLVTRDRDGLARDHPFAAALYATIEAALEPHLRRLREESERGTGVRQSESQRQRFDRVSKVLNEYLEEDEDGGGIGGNLPPFGLSVIPAVRVVEPGEPGRVSIRYRPEQPADEPPAVTVRMVDEDGEHDPVEVHMNARPDGAWYTAPYRAPGRDEGAVTGIRTSIGGDVAEGLIEWRSRPDAPPIESVQFDRASYGVRDGAQRVLRLLAPWDMVAAGDVTPAIELHGDPGVQLAARDLAFGYDEALHAGVCPVRVRGSGVGARARIVATAGVEAAETEVRVTTAAASGIRPLIDEFDVPQRAWLADGTLKVNALDPSVKAYLGPKQDNWPGQETPHFNAMLAEILASAVVRQKLQRKYPEVRDVGLLFGEYQGELAKLLPRVHSALVPAADRQAVEPWRRG